MSCWISVLFVCLQLSEAVWQSHITTRIAAPTVPEASVSLVDVPGLCNISMRGNPYTIRCPFDCPFLRLDPKHICQFECVIPAECGTEDPFVNFPDPNTSRCAACEVPACKLCSSKETCQICHENFRLEGGRCHEASSYWWLCWAIVGGVVFCAVIIVAWGLLQPIATNGIENLEHGLQHREQGRYHQVPDQSRRHDLETPREPEPYSFFANLCTNPLAGPGVVVHFRWHLAIIIWTACVLSALLVLEYKFCPRVDSLHPKDLHPADPLAFKACSLDVVQERMAIQHMEWAYFWTVLIIYMFSTISSFLLVRHLVHAFQNAEQMLSQDDAARPFINSYTLFIRGLPTKVEDYNKLPTQKEHYSSLLGEDSSHSVDSGTPEFPEKQVELHLMSLFKMVNPFVRPTIEGVSLCWDFRKVTTEVWKEAEQALAQTDERVRNLVDIPEDADASSPSTSSSEDNRALDLLEGLRPSGYAYVTFSTVNDCNEVLKMYEMEGGIRGFYGIHEDGYLKLLSDVELEPVSLGPKHILWEKFGDSWPSWCMKFLIGLVLIFFSVPVLDVMAYYPNVRHLLYYHDVPLMNEGNVLNGMLLGSLCGLLNVVIVWLIEKVLYYSGFTSRARSERAFLCLFFLATLANTVVDLSTYVISSLGYTGYSGVSITGGSIDQRFARMEDIVVKPGVQHQTFHVILSALPPTLLAQNLMEPLGMVLLPYLVFTRYVLINPKGTKEDAEEQLQHPLFDERRYGDTMVNVVLCTFMLIFTVHDLYKVFVWLLVFLISIYIWDHYRLLKFCSRTTFASFTVAEAGCGSLCVPCALIAGILVCRIYTVAGVEFHNLSEMHDVPEYFCSILFAAPATFLTHFVLHYLLIRFTIRYYQKRSGNASGGRMDATDGPQKSRNERVMQKQKSKIHTRFQVDRATPINYFNTNPVHCLRSKYILKENPPVCLHKYGKEYLLERTWEKRAEALQVADEQRESSQRSMTIRSPTTKSILSKFM